MCSLIHRLLENWRKIKYFIATINSISIIYKVIVRKNNDRPASLMNIDAEILKKCSNYKSNPSICKKGMIGTN